MGFCKTEFDTEKYTSVYEITVPHREHSFVERTLHEAAQAQGFDILIGRIGEHCAADGLHYHLGVALTDEAHYPQLMRTLDEAIYARRLEHIEATHGAGHPLSRYLKQLERAGAADDATRADFAAKIGQAREAAIQAAWDEWDEARAQWGDAPQPLLPGEG